MLLGRARVLLAGRFLRGGERRVLDWAGPGLDWTGLERELAGWNGTTWGSDSGPDGLD